MKSPEESYEKLKRIIYRVIKDPRSNFYREKFRKDNFVSEHFASADDIWRIPRLSREEISSTSPFDRLYCDFDKIEYIRYTSGTSASPLLLLFRPKQRYSIPGKRPLILTANNQLDHYFANALRSAAPPYFPPLIQSGQNLDATAILAHAYRIDAIVGLASRMIALAKSLSESTRMDIVDLFIQGERFTEDVVTALKALYPNAVLDSRYGMSEVGLFGYQCSYLKEHRRGVYHCDEDYLLEVTDPETGRFLGVAEEGEIIITELYDSPHQFIRYRTGDAGRFIEKKCPCGSRITFEVFGRIGQDIIRFAGGVLRVDEIERVLGEISELVEQDFRGEVVIQKSKDIGYVLLLTLVPRKSYLQHPVMESKVRDEISRRLFLTPTKTLKDFLELGRISDFIIRFANEFPQDTKAQRLKFKELPGA